MANTKRIWQLLILTTLSCAFRSELIFARSPDEGEFKAAAKIGDDIAKWIARIEPEPKSLAIYAINVNAPLEQDYGGILETEILKGAARRNVKFIKTCAQCKNPQVTVQGDHVVISKGTFDLEALKKVGQSESVEDFLVVDVFRSSFSVTAQAVIYTSPGGTVLKSERFTETAITFTDSSVQLLLTFGLGKVLTGKDPSNTSFAMSGNLMLLEELGFAKGGMDVGGILGGTNGMLVYVNPTLAFRGHFGDSGLAWSFMLGVGYGFTSEAKGLTFRGGYELFLSSWTEIGVEGVYLLPDVATPTLSSFIGLHIGIALGR